VTVVLLALRDPDLARRALTALAEQTGPAVDYRAIVVDATESVPFARFLRGVTGDLEVITAPHGGSRFALLRQAGDRAGSDHLAMLDECVEVQPGWLDALRAAVAGQGAAAGLASALAVDGARVVDAGYLIHGRAHVALAPLVSDRSHPWLAATRGVMVAPPLACWFARAALEACGWPAAETNAGWAWAGLCARLRAAGRRVELAPQASVSAPAPIGWLFSGRPPRGTNVGSDAEGEAQAAQIVAVEAPTADAPRSARLSSHSGRVEATASDDSNVLERWYAQLAPGVRGARVLEVDCGEGHGARTLAREAASVLAIDARAGMALMAGARGRSRRVRRGRRRPGRTTSRSTPMWRRCERPVNASKVRLTCSGSPWPTSTRAWQAARG